MNLIEGAVALPTVVARIGQPVLPIGFEKIAVGNRAIGNDCRRDEQGEGECCRKSEGSSGPAETAGRSTRRHFVFVSSRVAKVFAFNRTSHSSSLLLT